MDQKVLRVSLNPWTKILKCPDYYGVRWKNFGYWQHDLSGSVTVTEVYRHALHGIFYIDSHVYCDKTV